MRLVPEGSGAKKLRIVTARAGGGYATQELEIDNYFGSFPAGGGSGGQGRGNVITHDDELTPVWIFQSIKPGGQIVFDDRKYAKQDSLGDDLKNVDQAIVWSLKFSKEKK